MEWERAKTIILIIFVLLNIALGGLRFLDHRRYWMTGEQERNIRTVLDQNNIWLYIDPIRRFTPMRPIEVSGFYYDEDFLLDLFFDGAYVTRVEYDGGLVVFSSDDGRHMEKSNGFIFFEIYENGGVAPYADAVDRGFAQSLTSEFINRHFPYFEIDIVFDAYDFYGNHGIRRIYREIYQGFYVYSNFIEFFVSSHGITQIEMQFGRIQGESQVPPRMIFPPDEVLLTFMQRFRHIATESPIFINRMDMVYVKLYHSDEVGFVSPAIPFYRIFIEGSDFPRLINAFTNDLVY